MRHFKFILRFDTFAYPDSPQRSLAINYQVYVVAPAQAGAHSPLRSSWGESLVFDPWGVELGRLPSIDESEDRTKPMPSQLIIANFDPESVRRVAQLVVKDISVY